MCPAPDGPAAGKECLPVWIRRAAKWTGVLVLALALAFCGGVWLFQEAILFNGRTAEILETPADLDWSFEEFRLEVPGGVTHGWWIPLENARGAVVFSHGSGKNISHYLDDARIFRDLGFSVLLYDYGGYGLSTGKPSERRCYADIRAVWRHLTETLGVPPERVVLAGASMGGGVTSDLAAEVQPAAVVLECTFTSVPEAVRDTLPFLPHPLLTRIRFRNLDKVPGFRAPLLVLHSADDDTIPFAHGERLFAAAKEPKAFARITGSHGGGKFSSGPAYTEPLREFLLRHTPAP